MDIRMSNIASPMPQLRAKFTSKLGIPLSGCKVYTYEPNSDIPKTTWIDTDKTVENTNPILLDSAGEADIFLDGLYRIVVKDRFGFVVYDVEKTGTHTEWDASFVVDESGKTQQEINNSTTRTYKSISDLRTFKPRFDGERVKLNGLVQGSQVGGGEWYYDATDTTSTDNGWFIVVTSSGKRLKRVGLTTVIDLDWAGIPDSGDLALVLQQANDYIVGVANTKGVLGGVPYISLPASTYKMSTTVTLNTISRIVPQGNSVIDCKDWVDTTKGTVVIRILNTLFRQQGRPGSTQNTAILGASSGTITLIGAGGDVAQVTGVWVGNLSAGLTPVRGNILSNFTVINFHKGIEWGRYNIYLQRYNDCQFEGNTYNLYCSNADQADSGERNSFTNCVFGVAGINHVYHNQPALDINFEDCSFDFCSDSAVYTGANATFCTLKFTDCHFEHYPNYLVDGLGSSYKNIVFTNPVFLKTGGTIANSVSKPLFAPTLTDAGGTCKIEVNGYEMRTTTQAWDRNVFVTGALNSRGNNHIKMRGCFRDSWGHIPSLRSIKNVGYDMSGEVAGKTGLVGSEFTNFNVGSVGGVTALVNENKQIVLTKTQGGNWYTISTKPVPISVNSNFGLICSFIRNASRGGRQENYIDFYDANDVLISTVGGFPVNLDTYWDNTAAPNFASGDTRDICTQMQSMATPPQGAVKAVGRMTVSAFTTGLAITSMALVEFPT